jgi:beta-galactosidase/beta-glucuronidase
MMMNSRLLVVFLLFLMGGVMEKTQAESVIPRPEHPRPDFQRELWLNLNGEWEFEVDEHGIGEQEGWTTGKSFSKRILVPFAPESKLSGIGNTDFMTHVWYRRHFRVPASMKGKRLFLHFGAVDWHARVWLNGEFLGEHRGGYTPFRFEVTRKVRDGDNELVVHVIDETRSGKQATGKQSHERHSHGCFYTRTTGIWQTVWLEATGDTYLKSFVLTPDPDGGRVIFRGWIEGRQKGTKVRLRAYAGDKMVGEEIVPANWRNTLGVIELSTVKLWYPGKPYLYDLTITVERGGRVLDTVKSYFGLRKITIEGNRFLINGKPVFQRLVLDQGFYPDGIYTAPSDEALRRDIELAMAAGFNGARLHQKVFEPRFLYWADKLGYIVWGEYPSWGLNVNDYEAVTYAVNEWREVIERDRNHPSIIGWCPLNETDSSRGSAFAQILLATTQTMDPTRPWLDASGYVHFVPETDVYDCHDYTQEPEVFAQRYEPLKQLGTRAWNNVPEDPRSAYRGQPYFVSEYGGMRIRTERLSEGGWGYGETDLQEFLRRYKALTDALLDNPNMFGFCYTQLYDIEQEQNGVYYYDRQPKYDPALLKAINQRPAAYETQPPRVLDIQWQTLLPTSQQSGQRWRYTTTAPADGWFLPDFDDSQWQEGEGGFGTSGTPGAVVRTVWDTSDIWLRRRFQLRGVNFRYLALVIHHDEDAEVYINGTRVASFKGFVTGYVEHLLTDALKDVLKPGENVIAVHCGQTVGGQYIDVGIAGGR